MSKDTLDLVFSSGARARIRVRMLHVWRLWRVEVVAARWFLQVLWAEEWGVVNGFGADGWTIRRPILTIGRA